MRAPGGIKNLKLTTFFLGIVGLLVPALFLFFLHCLDISHFNCWVFDNLSSVLDFKVINYNTEQFSVFIPFKFLHIITAKQLEVMQKNIRDVIVGAILGDGSVLQPRRGLLYFKFKQSIVHIDYLAFIYFILKPLLTLGSPSFSQSYDKRFNATYSSYTLLSRTVYNDVLNLSYYRNLFYVVSPSSNKIVKTIPVNIGELLSPIALAIWLMDDGHFDHGAIFFNTQSFSSKGVNLLILAFSKRYGITAKARPVSGKPHQFRIFINAENTKILRELVLPYLCKSMYYKVGL